MFIQKFFIQTSSLALAALATAAPAKSEEATNLSFEASAGIAGDSNVGVPDLDRNSDEGDVALLLRTKIQLDVKPSDKLVLRGGYEVRQTSYQDFGGFDLTTHRSFAEAEYDFDGVKAGVMANLVHARLDGDGYLDYAQISPNLSKLFGDSLFLRAAYMRTEKDFKTADGRDASGDAGRVDAFYFLDGTRQYVTFGGEAGSEDAESDLFDLDHVSAKGGYVQRFNVFGSGAKMKLGAEVEQRDYKAVDPVIADRREDRIVSATSDLEVAIYGPLSMDLGYEYRDRSSNLDSADYDEHVGSVELKVSF